MAKLQVMTLDNLSLYDELIKGYVDAADAKSLKTATLEGNVLKLYRVSEPVGETAPAYEITLPETDISGLIAKMTGATAGNVVVANADGTVADGGVALTSLATKAEVEAVQDEVDALETLVGVIPDGYTSTTITGYAKELADAVAANGYDDTEIKGLIQDNTDAISELDGEVGDLTTLKTTEKTSVVDAINEVVDGKANVATTIAGYGITDAYTKTEVDSAITTAVANAEHLKRSIVAALPEVADADAHTIYMVEITGGDGNQKYEEFMLINGAFEKIGDSAVDLTDYATKDYVDNNKEVVTFKMNNSEVTSPTVFQPVIDAIFAGKMVEIEVNVGVKNIYRLANVDENSGLITFYELGFGSSNEGGFHRTKCLYITARIDTTTRQVITVSQYERFFDYISPTNRYDTPYIPQYEGSPATKKYVDTAIEAAITGALEEAY